MSRFVLRLLCSGVVVAQLSGCSERSDEPQEQNVFDAVAEPLDRAAEVQGVVDERAEALRRRLEEAEGR